MWLSARRSPPPLVLLGILPFLVLAIAFTGLVNVDAANRSSGLETVLKGGPLPGVPYADPNVGSTSFALGYRAASDLIGGHLPLWNPYEGLGAPLLGEMQSAALFPPTLLLLLPHGQAIEQALLQLFAGLGAYLFFRKFGLGLTAALTGGLLFEVNGVFAWLKHAPFNPVALLPWLFWCIETCRAAAALPWRERLPAIGAGGLLAALAVYAGFPETAYLYAFLLVLWAGFRMASLPRMLAVDFAVTLFAVAVLATALSAPLLVSFAGLLAEGVTGPHDAGFADVWLGPVAQLQYLLPYVFGPILDTTVPAVLNTWGVIGGYAGFTAVAAALAALLLPGHRGAKLLLTAWVVIAVGTSQGMPGIRDAFMMLPLTKTAASFRYLNASWIFCIVFLAALFIDGMTGRRAIVLGLCGAAALAALGFMAAWPELRAAWAARNTGVWWTICALLLAGGGGVVLAGAAAMGNRALAASALIGEAAVCFFLPLASYPRLSTLDTAARDFLKANIGLQRIVNTPGGSLHANYGSAWEIPTLNYDDVPVPRRTPAFLHTLDPTLDSRAVTFILGTQTPEQEAARDRTFREHLADYAAVGVKYVLAGADFQAQGVGAPVHAGKAFSVYELPNVRPYFTAEGCAVTPLSHTHVETECAAPARLVRLEVLMDGWTAHVNGDTATVVAENDTFQAVALPAGRSVVTFSYWPRGFTAALVAAAAAWTIILFAAYAGGRRSVAA